MKIAKFGIRISNRKLLGKVNKYIYKRICILLYITRTITKWEEEQCIVCVCKNIMLATVWNIINLLFPFNHESYECKC